MGKKKIKSLRQWQKTFDANYYDLPIPRIYPEKQTKYEKKMANLMNKLVDYQWTIMNESKSLKTPFGIFFWIPKKHNLPTKKENDKKPKNKV